MAVFNCPFIFLSVILRHFTPVNLSADLVVCQIFVNKKKDRRASILFQPN
jgi:hypothetical protein